MFQLDGLGAILADPAIIRYLIGGIIILVIIIICYSIHNKLTKA